MKSKGSKNNEHKLHNDQLFRFHHFDGFTDRLLSVDILVKEDHTYEASFAFYAKGASEKKVIPLTGNLPQNILNALKALLAEDDLKAGLKHVYGNIIDDADEQLYVFPQQTLTVRGLSKNEGATFTGPVEQLFLVFREALRNWINETYSALEKGKLTQVTWKTLIKKPWDFTFEKSEEGYRLTVSCGTVDVFDKVIVLDKQQIRRYNMEGDQYIVQLAKLTQETAHR